MCRFCENRPILRDIILSLKERCKTLYQLMLNPHVFSISNVRLLFFLFFISCAFEVRHELLKLTSNVILFKSVLLRFILENKILKIPVKSGGGGGNLFSTMLRFVCPKVKDMDPFFCFKGVK